MQLSRVKFRPQRFPTWLSARHGAKVSRDRRYHSARECVYLLAAHDFHDRARCARNTVKGDVTRVA